MIKIPCIKQSVVLTIFVCLISCANQSVIPAANGLEEKSQTSENRMDFVPEPADTLLPPGDLIIRDLPVNDIEVSLTENVPPQVIVSGYLSDSCAKLGEITQKREGNTVHIHITTTHPRDAACAQVIEDIEERVDLEGDFPPGSYKIIVNDMEKEARIS